MRCLVLCEPAQSKCTWTFHKSHFVWKFTGKVPNANPATPFCANLRSRNAHGHFTRAILCGNLQEKCRTLIPRHPFCASLRSRNAHGHFTRAILCGNLQEKCWALISGPLFCASLRSRNALGHFTRAILCGNLQGRTL